MHSIDDYVFDDERLVFYKKDIPFHIKQKIEETIPKSDKYTDLVSGLDKLENKKRSAINRPIDLIGICLTYNCQLRCNYCSYSSGSGNNEYLRPEDILRFVLYAIKKRIMFNMVSTRKNMGPMRFFFTGGGEPTYKWDLFRETVETIKNKCEEYNIPYYFELTTNGLLNVNQRDYIKTTFNKVMISYDGLPEIQNRNRTCAISKLPSNNVVEDSIRDFIQSKLVVTIRSTVWHYDFVRLKEMCDNMVKSFSGFNEWSIMPIIPSGRALDGNDLEKRYDIKEYNFLDYYLELIKYAKTKGYTVYISTPVFNNVIADYCCGATFVDCFWLMPDKTIINCIEAERFRIEIGKISGQKVEIYEEYEDTFLETVRNSFKKCKNCLAYRFCKGGCPLKTIRDQNYGTNYKQYECYMIQQYWMYIFRHVIKGENCFGWETEKIMDSSFKTHCILKLVKKGKKNEDK